MADLDVTGNIRVIERLKAGLLSDVAGLYESMLPPPAGDASERLDILAEIIIQTYAISNRLGVSPGALDNKVSSKLRLGVLDDHEPLKSDFQSIIAHMDRRRERR